MGAKEKAEELVNKFMDIKNVKMSDYSIIYFPTAKRCALIAVDEIIDMLDAETWGLEMYEAFDRQNYWQQVKQEIEKL